MDYESITANRRSSSHYGHRTCACPTAVGMASTIQVDGVEVYNLLHFSAALVTLAAAIICMMFFKGIISLMPILIGIIVGYIYSAFIGILDFTTVMEAKWFEFPEMLIPGIDYEFVITPTLLLIMVPIAIVTISEHIGHQLVLGRIVGQRLHKKSRIESLFTRRWSRYTH